MSLPRSAAYVVLALVLAGCAEDPDAAPLVSAEPAVAPQDTAPLPPDGRPLTLYPIALEAVLAEYPDAKLAVVRCAAEDIWVCQDDFEVSLDGTGSEWLFHFATSRAAHGIEVVVARNGTILRSPGEPRYMSDNEPPLVPLPSDPRVLDTARVAELLRADPEAQEAMAIPVASWWYALGVEEDGRSRWIVGWMGDPTTFMPEIRMIDPIAGTVEDPRA